MALLDIKKIGVVYGDLLPKATYFFNTDTKQIISKRRDVPEVLLGALKPGGDCWMTFVTEKPNRGRNSVNIRRDAIERSAREFFENSQAKVKITPTAASVELDNIFNHTTSRVDYMARALQASVTSELVGVMTNKGISYETVALNAGMSVDELGTILMCKKEFDISDVVAIAQAIGYKIAVKLEPQ